MALEAVLTTYSLPEAAVACSLLRASDVPAFAFGEHFGSVSWHYLIAIGGLSVVVPGKRAAEAREILAAGRVAPVVASDSAAFWRRPVVHGALAAAALLFGLNCFPFWVRAKRALAAPNPGA